MRKLSTSCVIKTEFEPRIFGLAEKNRLLFRLSDLWIVYYIIKTNNIETSNLLFAIHEANNVFRD